MATAMAVIPTMATVVMALVTESMASDAVMEMQIRITCLRRLPLRRRQAVAVVAAVVVVLVV
jgi:hypothetical protein